MRSIRFPSLLSSDMNLEGRLNGPNMAENAQMTGKIAFQGDLGAYSHEACVKARPDMQPLSCHTFEEVIDAVRTGKADLAMLPVENSTYGRVADIHRLLPESGLHIVDEAFVRVRIALMGLPGSTLRNTSCARPPRPAATIGPLPAPTRHHLQCRRRQRRSRCGTRTG